MQVEAPTVEWRKPEEGFEFQPDTITVTREYQQEKLSACGLDDKPFRGFVDASFFIGIGIHAGIKSGISAEGNVNMLQSLVQHRPVRPGEPLLVKGYIRKMTEVPRGVTIDTSVEFIGEDGKPAISASRISLKPDPKKIGVKGAGTRPPPVIEDMAALVSCGEYQLTPEKVKSYSMEGNSIHYEMEAANRAGFRAPIIGGGMGVHYLLHSLWQKFNPRSFSLDIYFRRPIFWDDPIEVYADQINGDWRAMCLTRGSSRREQAGEKKVLTAAAIQKLETR